MVLCVIAYVVLWAVMVQHARSNSYHGSFIAALTTSTTITGLVSRFTGWQTFGDTFTGLFALVPGWNLHQNIIETA